MSDDIERMCRDAKQLDQRRESIGAGVSTRTFCTECGCFHLLGPPEFCVVALGEKLDHALELIESLRHEVLG